jgi:pimeloyl-ACP methyl ester carboxylesterase
MLAGMNEAKYREAERRLWRSVGRTPTEQQIVLPRIGGRVRVQEVGEGPPALFIHGGPNSGSTWAPLVEHLGGLRCLLLDRPGTGLSESIGLRASGLVEFASSLVADVLDALELERAHVVASSLGGYCALWSATADPERFDRMVQMACPALLPDQQIPKFMKAIMLPGVRKVIAALPPNKKAEESIMREIGHGASIDAGLLPEAHGEWYAALQRYTDTMRNDFDLIHSLKAKGGFDQTVVLGADTLATVRTPTHFIWGADDTFGGADVANWMVEAMPSATVEIRADSGHLPWLDAPASVAGATQEFLLDS